MSRKTGCLAAVLVCAAILLVFLATMRRSTEDLLGAAGYDVRNAPITFYGRVVDQDGNGVPGVEVKGHYTAFDIVESLTRETYGPIPISVHTDAHGGFVFNGVRGRTIQWDTLSKGGYVFNQHTFSYYYAGDSLKLFKPDPANPVLYHMWREVAPKERLIHFDSAAGIFKEEGPISVYFGLPCHVKKGRFEDADLIVSVRHDNPIDINAINTPRSHYTWAFRFESPTGGVILTQDPYIFQAPAAGYQKSCEFAMDATNPDWSYDVYGVQLYVKSKNPPIYTALRGIIQCDLKMHVTDFSFSGELNPSGSRNLEP